MNPKYTLFFLVFLVFPFTGCYKNEPVPVAGFGYTGNNQFQVPCTVAFSNTSSNAFSYLWRFGDDSTSVLKNPSHTYREPGKYEVYLRAYTESQKEWASLIKIIVIKDTL